MSNPAPTPASSAPRPAAKSARPASPPAPRKVSLWRDRVLPATMLLLMAGALWATHPAGLRPATPQSALHTQSCLSNLGRIAAAFALYAQDYDGKFPRGVDPVDRQRPDTWKRYNGMNYYSEARTLPMLHEVLQPYLKDPAVWHCPADGGWEHSRLPGFSSSEMPPTKPSSWAVYGTSYYYLTIHGFAGLRAADIDNPRRDVVVFDGDLWHRIDRRDALNALFADGHVENMEAKQFGALLGAE